MFDRKELEYVGEVKMPSLPNQPRIGTPDVRMARRKRRRKPKVDEYALTSLMSSGLVVGDVAKAYITGGAALAKRYWNEALHPRGWHGRFGHGNGPDARNHRDDVSPFPEAKAPRARKATGARAAKTTAAPKLSKPPVATPAAKKVAAKKTTAPAKRAAPVKTAAKKTTVSPAPKVGVSSSSAAGHYDHKTQNIRDRKAIPRINRGGTHIMYDDNKKPLVRSPYDDPGAAYYARNAGPKRITNERLKEIFEDPSKMTAEEKRMISSAGGAKSLDGNDTISVETSRGTRHLERYAVFGQLRSKIAPGSGDRSATRQDAEAREKQAAKRRASGKVSSTQFGKVSAPSRP